MPLPKFAYVLLYEGSLAVPFADCGEHLSCIYPVVAYFNGFLGLRHDPPTKFTVYSSARDMQIVLISSAHHPWNFDVCPHLGFFRCSCCLIFHRDLCLCSWNRVLLIFCPTVEFPRSCFPRCLFQPARCLPAFLHVFHSHVKALMLRSHRHNFYWTLSTLFIEVAKKRSFMSGLWLRWLYWSRQTSLVLYLVV